MLFPLAVVTLTVLIIALIISIVETVATYRRHITAHYSRRVSIREALWSGFLVFGVSLCVLVLIAGFGFIILHAFVSIIDILHAFVSIIEGIN